MKKIFGLVVIAILMQACGYQVPDPKPYAVDGLKNSMKVGDMLFAGQPSPEMFKLFAEQGFKTIISTRGLDEVEWDEPGTVTGLGMDFHQVPIGKPFDVITDEHLEQFSSLMESAKKPIVLHCGSANRASSLWAVWLVEEKGVSVDEAFRLATLAGMRSMRKVAEKRLGLSTANTGGPK